MFVERSVRIGNVTISMEAEKFEKAIEEAFRRARENPRVSLWNWKIAFLREFLNSTALSLRFSKVISEIFEKGLEVTNPELHSIFEKLEGKLGKP